ncbi:streptomycin 6-kinase [Nocardiopsis mwathae]|uniref:Streptomycin 6-kinase n=1 Tax=Nocardiopsis mwathae TaxID=1472723 RepID=A0A7W9YLQ9_9ACTN|nr:aminoglycoside phosphotransferase family protein [Nocardiopsis mwathae]MBB6174492.1 streptomycin 6-kinase [Nocardiopsis mwathae]
MSAAPDLLTTAARRWNLTATGYHDVGHASLIATATTVEDERVLLKAWPDATRFRAETDALCLWAGGPVVRLVAAAGDHCVAALAQVGCRPGGCRRPEDEADVTALALHQVHSKGRSGTRLQDFESLDHYIDTDVRPRIGRRSHLAREHGYTAQLAIGGAALRRAKQCPRRATLLHADLYQENVLFDERARPVFIDPLPMVGDAVFDWAFWIVYYTLGSGTRRRFDVAAHTSGISVHELRTWCLVLCLDGLLYYLDVDDPRAPRIAEVLLLISQEWGQ